jgi:asparagine synthetase B (glutamine-hydrolysing)
MPGICGFFNKFSNPDATSLTERMVSELRAPACRIVSARTDRQGRFGLGRVSPGHVPTSPQPVILGKGCLHAVMDGVLVDMDRLCGEMRSIGYRFTNDDYASVLLAHYAYGGIGSLDVIEGVYSAAIIDLSNRTVTLITDRSGTQPLYYLNTEKRFAFASSVSSLIVESDSSLEIAPSSMPQDGITSQHGNGKSAFGVIRQLPAASALVFDAGADRISIRALVRNATELDTGRVVNCEFPIDRQREFVREPVGLNQTQ